MPLTPTETRALLARLGHAAKAVSRAEFPRRRQHRPQIARARRRWRRATRWWRSVPGWARSPSALLEAGAEVWAVEKDRTLHGTSRPTLAPAFPRPAAPARRRRRRASAGRAARRSGPPRLQDHRQPALCHFHAVDGRRAVRAAARPDGADAPARGGRPLHRPARDEEFRRDLHFSPGRLATSRRAPRARRPASIRAPTSTPACCISSAQARPLSDSRPRPRRSSAPASSNAASRSALCCAPAARAGAAAGWRSHRRRSRPASPPGTDSGGTLAEIASRMNRLTSIA